jgi:hypothetical protein
MDDKIVFRCDCGVSLGAPRAAAGRRGRCKRCGRTLTVPEASDTTVSDNVQIIEEFCSICQTTIAEEELQTRCDACGLPFHDDCWTENLGCSAYGCSNVSVLKQGPDLRISAPPSLPVSRPVLRPAVQSAAATPETDIPWEYVLLAGSALGLLMGLLCFGMLSLFLLIGTVLYFMQNGDTAKRPVIGICMLISGLGILWGLIASLIFYL